ncbi:MAG: MBL fold metallo-hydrolase [Candidatus Hodarchaeota archaeon]
MSKKNRCKSRFGVICLFLVFILLITLNSTEPMITSLNQPVVDSESLVDSVKITVLIDNYPNGTLDAPWGLSIFIETPDLAILFDAGSDPNSLRKNTEKLGINLSQLDLVVISHGHRDHVHGFSYIPEQSPNITVFVPKYMPSVPKELITSLNVTIVEVDSTYAITDDIVIIGGFYDPVNEQSLAINVKGLGLIIFVGCSHPGVDNIVQKAIDDLGIRLYALIGGFHLIGEGEGDIAILVDELLATNLIKICPTHCSGDIIRNYLQTNYPSHYEEIKVGYSTIFQSNEGTPSFEFSYVIGGLISLFVIIRKKKMYNETR